MLASAPALSELDLLREPLSVAAHTAAEHVRELESSGAFSCLKTKPVYVENAPSQVPYAGESTSTPTDMRQLPGKMRKQKELLTAPPPSHWPRHDPIFIASSWFDVPPGLGLPT